MQLHWKALTANVYKNQMLEKKSQAIKGLGNVYRFFLYIKKGWDTCFTDFISSAPKSPQYRAG